MSEYKFPECPVTAETLQGAQIRRVWADCKRYLNPLPGDGRRTLRREELLTYCFGEREISFESRLDAKHNYPPEKRIQIENAFSDLEPVAKEILRILGEQGKATHLNAKTSLEDALIALGKP